MRIKEATVSVLREVRQPLTAQLPEELLEGLKAVDDYDGSRHNALLKRVYEKFPAYATKSRLRKRKPGKGKAT